MGTDMDHIVICNDIKGRAFTFMLHDGEIELYFPAGIVSITDVVSCSIDEGTFRLMCGEIAAGKYEAEGKWLLQDPMDPTMLTLSCSANDGSFVFSFTWQTITASGHKKHFCENIIIAHQMLVPLLGLLQFLDPELVPINLGAPIFGLDLCA